MQGNRGTNQVESPESVVLDNLPLVGYVVSAIAARLPDHVSRDELRSAGLAALVQAARSYDPERGSSFASFATARIKGAIVDELRSADWASRSVRATARRREAAEDALNARLGRYPTIDEVAASLGTPSARLLAAEQDAQRAVVLSLHAATEAGTLGDAVEDGSPTPDERLLQRERLGYLRDAVANLPGRLRIVVERYYLQECLSAQIATELGVTESRVSQMRAEALTLIRDALNTHLAPELVGVPARPDGGLARRREAYFSAVARHSDYRTRLSTPLGDEWADEIA